jgi:TRAP-type mannitol/chloroaromatic compound transport system permease small subunit
MNPLIRLSQNIDRLNDLVGRTAYWLVLVMVLIAAGNAVWLYLFRDSSNAWLELQWYLFSAVFLLCAGYTLLHRQHVRIDVVYARFSRRTQLWIDLLGSLFFLLPMAALILWLSVPWFLLSFHSGEMSGNSGGLIIWPAKLLVPIGFALLILQGLSEIIKRVAILQGALPDTLSEDARMATGHADTAPIGDLQTSLHEKSTPGGKRT